MILTTLALSGTFLVPPNELPPNTIPRVTYCVMADGSTGPCSLTPVPGVPGPLPLLGAAAAYKVSRDLRKRIKQND